MEFGTAVSGLIWSSGEVWRTMHQFSLRHLRQVGFGKTLQMEAVVRAELKDFTVRLKTDVLANQGILHIHDNFSLSLVNVLWSFIVGARHSLDETQIRALLVANDEVVKTIKLNSLVVTYPGIRTWFPRITGFKRQMNAFTTQQDLFRVRQWKILYILRP